MAGYWIHVNHELVHTSTYDCGGALGPSDRQGAIGVARAWAVQSGGEERDGGRRRRKDRSVPSFELARNLALTPPVLRPIPIAPTSAPFPFRRASYSIVDHHARSPRVNIMRNSFPSHNGLLAAAADALQIV